MRDMTPGSDRSIRNIPVHQHRRPVAGGPPRNNAAYQEDFTHPTPPRRRRMRFGWFFWAVIVVIVVAAGGGILLSTTFAGATITVTPKHQTITLPPTINAQLNAAPGILTYQIVTSSRQGTTSAQATGSQKVSRQASGVITISNTYSTAPQRLIANTRFEAPDGKMYRIHDSVDVPGATKKADGILTPGTVSVTVYADSPGAEYNRDATVFTIPGFKGDPRYGKFSAQAQAITNGFVGNEPAVAAADLQKAQNDLQKGLTDAMQNAASTQIPKEFMLVPGTLKVTFGSITKGSAANGTVSLSETAQASGYVIRMSDLAAVVAKQKIPGYNGEAVNFVDVAQVAVSLSSTSTPGSITLGLSGSPAIVWQFDPNSLKQALVGKAKSAFETIVQSFAPAIECTKDTPCKASVRPFWSPSFPTDATKITIVTGQ